ncbi:HNH endonuclease [Streptomyces ovatisporus]|uniref:HNH endonuclease n=1 Tax=Streptomyces ovatisporus TaxID=1128682 RepID=A0ABV9A7N1_9ACTN
MANNWSSSDRKARLPSNWAKLRLRVLRRDGYRCMHIEITGSRCTADATDVDHIKAGDDHSMTNLQSLCREHHQVKTQQEAQAGRRRGADSRAKYPKAKHPGMI